MTGLIIPVSELLSLTFKLVIIVDISSFFSYDVSPELILMFCSKSLCSSRVLNLNHNYLSSLLALSLKKARSASGLYVGTGSRGSLGLIE